MNLEGFDRNLPPDYSATVLHEFGHALGFNHEHQSPRSGCDDEFRWEDDPDGAQGIYSLLAGPPNYWPKWKVDSNLRQMPDSSAYDVSAHDPNSIMHYSFEPWMLKRGEKSQCFVTKNRCLSVLDRQGMRRAYPYDQPDVAKVIKDIREALKSILRLQDLQPRSRESYELHLDSLPKEK
jgi:hypothetical protein